MWGRGTITLADGPTVEITTREPVGPKTNDVNFWAHGGRAGVSATVRARPGTSYDRLIDVSEGSPERRFVEQVAEGGRITFHWLPEDVQVEYEVRADVRARCPEVLAAPRDFAVDDRFESHHWALGAVPAELQPRSTAPPARPIPYFAPHSGAVPPAGTPVVGGVQLPPGDRCGNGIASYWATFDTLENPSELVARLAEAFPETGLWPFCWMKVEHGDPDTMYRTAPADLDAIGTRDPEEIVRTWWKSVWRYPDALEPFGDQPFPGFADPPEPGATGARPFRVVDVAIPPQDDQRRRLLLVPCNRPADALAVIGWGGQRLEVLDLCAVLRSWEERFAAVAVGVDPWATTFTVGAPPTTMEQALLLAAEFFAVATHDDSLRDLAKEIVWRGEVPRQVSRCSSSVEWTLDFDHD